MKLSRLGKRIKKSNKVRVIGISKQMLNWKQGNKQMDGPSK